MFNFVKGIKKILLLQRNEYQSNSSKFLRKLFGRELHTRFFINFTNNNLQKINNHFYKDMKNEFDKIKFFLPKKAYNILDIGCGIGAINIFLNNHYDNLPNFHLLDKNFVSNKIIYGFKKIKTEGYNNLLTTKHFLEANNIKKDKINIYDVDKDELIDLKYDLVISLVSWGYHYPLETYIDYLKKNATNKTIFIFDIAVEYISIEDVKKYFNKIEIINRYQKKHQQIRLFCSEIK